MAPVATTMSAVKDDNAAVGALGKSKSGRALKVRAYPRFDSLEEERLYRKQHLAAAYRVFAERGFDEGVAGHISVRDPILTDHFCENNSRIIQRRANMVQGSILCPSTSLRYVYLILSSWYVRTRTRRRPPISLPMPACLSPAQAPRDQ